MANPRPPAPPSPRQITDAVQSEVQRKATDALVDPVMFSRAYLGKDLWATQEAILHALSVPRARVAVRACHASSKTFTAAIAVIHFMQRFPDGIVATTAPTWHQIRNLLWKEMHAAKSGAKISLPDMDTTSWYWTKDHYAVGLSTTEAERFQGLHAPHVLIVIDEAPGVREAIWEAIESIESGGDVRILALGNPTISSGRFYQAFNRNSGSWKLFTISAFDTPNLEGLNIQTLQRWEETGDPRLYDNPRPYLATRHWVLQRYKEWGPNSPLWIARVMGRFPSKSGYALFALEWAEGMRYQTGADIPVLPGHSLGVDVARYGSNNTVYTHMYGGEVTRIKKVQGRSTTETTAEIRRYFREDPNLTIVVDDSGVGGAVVDGCRAADIPVIAFNAAASPVHPKPGDVVQMRNWGSEAYWEMAAAMEAGQLCLSGEIEPDLVDELIEQLVGIEYKVESKWVTVFKEGLEKKLPSPDLADSLLFAWIGAQVARGNLNLASLEIAPQFGAGAASIRDRPSFWGGSGPGSNGSDLSTSRSGPTFGGDSGGTGLFNGRNPDGFYLRDPQAQAASMRAEDITHMLCPQCGGIANVRELGRTGGIRHFEVTCPYCKHGQAVHVPANGGVPT